MNTRLCTFEDLTSHQIEQLRHIQVHPEQIAFCGDIDCALHSLPLPAHPGVKAFILLQDEVAVAFLLLKREPLLAHWADAASATLHAFQVDKRVQGQGLGKVCLQALRVQVNHYWPEILRLMLSVSPLNVSALKFYLAQGWVENGEAYKGERRLVLQLSPPTKSQHAG